jgi:adenine-specific DNA-methyltransferase
MKLNIQTPRKFLNPLLSQKSVVATDVEAFKAAMVKYVQDVQELTATKQSEPNIVAGALMPFLQATPMTYDCRPHSQKGQSGIDLAILNGKDVAVIIEAKAVGSKDMITAHDLNRKAFHESIFYFMKERDKGNDKLTNIVITDFYQWFVFDAKDFDRLFWRNTQLKKVFHSFHDRDLLTTTTKEVYEAIGKELPKIIVDFFTEESIDCAYFSLAAPASIKDKELTAIYKLLSADCLLKRFNPNDANSLNREFYNELLYILGLEEIKDGGKRLIQASGISGSLYDGIADKLDQKGAPHAFEDVIKLIIIWINRILFLKLLESQIVTWTGEKSSRFMRADKISSFDALDSLFFDTLARRIPDRKNKIFAYIPYLNSSLFEMQEDEKTGINISALPDGAQIAYYSKTVVKDDTTKRKSGQTNTLAYLFEFLDAYDFANDSDKEVRAETKSLISASVLGLIFEKINGYKDGSFYTPSFVTMYMARQTIEKAVLQKFNEKYSWSCTALKGEGGLKNQLKDHKVKKSDGNALIDSLKICDPAVGSGHFLVSALNEILYIKSLLGLLVDEAGDVLDYDIVIENDELIVTSDKGELFEYKKGSKEKTLVQKTLFQEKQKIIENCLFGVDINPNSVNICRLRMWIELLKNAYYQTNGELETLPNIDINIKCGNSLISRFALDTDLKDALKKSKISVEDYREAVSNYRNTSDKTEKKKIEILIESIKTNFRKEIEYLHLDPKQKRFIELPKIIKALETSQSLLVETTKEEKARKLKQANLKAEFETLSTEVEDIKSSKIYQSAFEWRFEFPEVMDAEGKFVGFDVVIGNPPYGVPIANNVRELIISKLGKVPDYGIQYFFINLAKHLLRPNGIKTFIIPNTLLFNVLAKKYREQLLSNWQIDELLDCTNFDIFDEATVKCIITQFINIQTSNDVNYRPTENTSSFQQLISQSHVSISQSRLLANNQNWGLVFKLKPEILILVEKIRATGEKLNAIFPDISQGLIAYDSYQGQDEFTIKNRVFHSHTPQNGWKKWLWGEDVNSYVVKWNEKEYINYSAAIANPRSPKFFQGSRLLIREISNPKILAGYTSEESYNDPSIINILDTNENFDIKVLLGILNSKLATYYHFNASPKATKGAFPKILVDDIKNFPIPKISSKQKSTLTAKVNAILKAKPKGADTSKLEREIDDMVYRLYGLTYDEVKTIEPDYSSMSREEYEAYCSVSESDPEFEAQMAVARE